MADFKTTVALEIGAQSVSMAVFTPAGKGFALSRYARRDVLLDPVEEGMRIDYVSNAIGEMVEELKVRGHDVRNVVSGQQVFMRFIKLPALDMNDLSEQVGYEAQQHIPFPIDDIVYSYQVLSESSEGEHEVLLVAIKKDVLDSLNTQVESNSLHTRSVDCSITSLYNAYRVSYPEDTDPVVILDIGAKTTDIIFSENGRFFTRSVTAAGSFVTNSISREFGMSFRDAEKFKIEHGQISLGNGHTDSMSEEDAALATVIRTAMNRLSSEVQRTINHYRAQYKGNPPVKAYICGGGARIPYAVEFLQSALNLPVEFLNPLAAFSVGSKVDTEALEMDALCLGPVAGAAVTGAKCGEFNIDLVPTSVGKERAEKQLIPWAVAAGIIAVAGAGLYAYAANSHLDGVQKELSIAERDSRSVDQIKREADSSLSRFRSAEKRVEELNALNAQRKVYAALLRQMADRTSSYKFWLTEFCPLTNYKVQPVNPQTIASHRLIRENAGRVAGSSLLKPRAEEGDSEEAATPKVTAIYISGYVLRDPGGDRNSAAHQAAVLDAIVDRLDREGYLDSFFDLTKADVSNNSSLYVQFDAADGKNAARGAAAVPDYVQRFHMVLPLKEDKVLSVPEWEH